MAHLLVVEDDRSIAHLLRMMFTRASHMVTPAANGIEAVDLAIQLQPDLIVMDVELPLRNGWIAIGMLKADERTKQIPIIALTAHASTDSEAMARALGCAAFVAKPFEVEHLLTLVSHLVERVKSVGGASSSCA